MRSASVNPADTYISRLGIAHSWATARSALRTIARVLGVDTINWSSLTYADFARVRVELLHRHRWDSRAELARDLFNEVDVFYDLQRRHLILGYLSTVDYETVNAA